MRKILITAGPTREAIDPVRFLSNRSTGRMGFALATAAIAQGHHCTIITGPVALATPFGVDRIDVVSASEMFAAVRDSISSIDIAIFSAAVADYTPAEVFPHKLKKQDGDFLLKLVRTRDILGCVRSEFRFSGTLVGFAAETENVEENALSKLARKGCDFIVANDVSQPGIGFGSEENQVILFQKRGTKYAYPVMNKLKLAGELIRRFTDAFETNQGI